jgi:hypothetical protein
MVDKAEEFNYTSTQECDGCKKVREGTMLHCNDAMGLATPVLFLCDRCHKPNWYQRKIDAVGRFFKRTKNTIRRYATTTKAERDAHKKRMAEARARIEARRAEREAA